MAKYVSEVQTAAERALEAALPRSLAQTLAIQRGIEQFDATSLLPASDRQMMAMHDGIAKMAGANLFGSNLFEATRLGAAFPVETTWSKALRNADFVSQIRNALAAPSLQTSDFQKAVASFNAHGAWNIGGSWVPRLSGLAGFEHSIRDVVPAALQQSWIQEARLSSITSLSFFDQGWTKAAALLTSVPGVSSAAMVSWLPAPALRRRRRRPKVSRAALSPEAFAAAVDAAVKTALAEVEVEVDVRCINCSSPILSKGKGLHWAGPRKAVKRVLVVPVCSDCELEAQEDPTFWKRAIHGERAPLVLYQGGATGPTEKRRAPLRLVVDNTGGSDDDSDGEDS